MIRKIKDEAFSERSSGLGVDGAKSYHQSNQHQVKAASDDIEKKKRLDPPLEEEQKRHDSHEVPPNTSQVETHVIIDQQ
jgi:hypothetical protein